MASIVFRCKACLRYCQTTQELNEHFELLHIAKDINDSNGERNVASLTEGDSDMEIEEGYCGKPHRNEASCSDDDETEAKGSYYSDTDSSSDSGDGDMNFLVHEKKPATNCHPTKMSKAESMLENDDIQSPTSAQVEPSFRDAYWGELGRNEDNRSDSDDDETEAKGSYYSDTDSSPDSGDMNFLAHEKKPATKCHPTQMDKAESMLENDDDVQSPASAQAGPSFRDAYWGGLGRNEDNCSDSDADDDDEKEVWTDNILEKEDIENVILSTLFTGDAANTNNDEKFLERSPKRQVKRQVQFGNYSISKKLKSTLNASKNNAIKVEVQKSQF